jgi:iron complex outermembrane receptor protein
VENNAVIVTGVSGATQLKKVPFQVSVLRKQDLAQNSSSNIIEALAKRPGGIQFIFRAGYFETGDQGLGIQ